MDLFCQHVAKFACGCGCSDEDSTTAALDYLTEISKTINELKSKLNSGLKVSPDAMSSLEDIYAGLEDMHAALTSESEPAAASSETVILKVSGDFDEVVRPAISTAAQVAKRVLPAAVKPEVTEAQKAQDYQRLAEAMRKLQNQYKTPLRDVSAPPLNNGLPINKAITPAVTPAFNRSDDLRLA